MSRNYDLHLESLALEAHARLGGSRDDGRDRVFRLQRGNLIVTILSQHVEPADVRRSGGGPASTAPAPDDGPEPPGSDDGADVQAAPRPRGRRSCECMTALIRFLGERGTAYFTDFTDEFGEEFGDSAIARALKKIVAAGIASHPDRKAPYRLIGDD